MAKLGRRCSICAAPATKLAVDAVLLTGEPVARAIALYADTLGFSPAAAYRHARHANSVNDPLSVPMPDGETPADQLRLLVAVQRSQLAALNRADASHDDKASAAASDRLNRSVHEFVDLAGLDAQNVAQSLEAHEDLAACLYKAGRANPALMSQLADGLSAVGATGHAEHFENFYSHLTPTESRIS